MLVENQILGELVVNLWGMTTKLSRTLGELMAQIHQTFALGEASNELLVRKPSINKQVPARAWRKFFVRMLCVGDASVLVSCMAIYVWIAKTQTSLTAGILVICIWLLCLAVLRTRAIDQIGSGATEYKRVLNASVLTAGAVSTISVVAQDTALRPILLIVVPIASVGLLIQRWGLRRWLNGRARQGSYLSNVVVVGSAQDILYVQTQLARSVASTYHVVGTVIDGEYRSDTLEKESFGGLMTVERSYGIDTVTERVRSTGADALIIAGSLRGGNTAVQELCWGLESTETQIIMVSSLTNVAGPRIRVRPVDGLPMMHVDLPSFSGAGFVLKRAMDIFVSALALVFLLPILGTLSLLVRMDSPGKIFFAQERVGLRHSRFRMFKFRSMVQGAEALRNQLSDLDEGNGVLFKVRHDPRITAVGRWMRKHSLDELPQFLNVLRGEMSLVGPRPPLPEEVAAYTGPTERRLYIKPGLTGLWQVSGRSDLPEDEALRLDLYYVENWSLLGDLMIMWRTLKVMLNGKGAY